VNSPVKAAPWDTSWYPVPKGHDVCPVCNGTGQRELSEKEQAYSWNKGKTHAPCLNCGGQTMGGRASGYTKVDPNTGEGCHHTYTHRSGGRCYHIYTCTKCGDQYDIDSGD